MFETEPTINKSVPDLSPSPVDLVERLTGIFRAAHKELRGESFVTAGIRAVLDELTAMGGGALPNDAPSWGIVIVDTNVDHHATIVANYVVQQLRARIAPIVAAQRAELERLQADNKAWSEAAQVPTPLELRRCIDFSCGELKACAAWRDSAREERDVLAKEVAALKVTVVPAKECSAVLAAEQLEGETDAQTAVRLWSERDDAVAEVVRLRGELESLKTQPGVHQRETGAGDFDVMCNGCCEVVSEQHPWDECVRRLTTAWAWQCRARIEAQAELDRFKYGHHLDDTVQALLGALLRDLDERPEYQDAVGQILSVLHDLTAQRDAAVSRADKVQERLNILEESHCSKCGRGSTLCDNLGCDRAEQRFTDLTGEVETLRARVERFERYRDVGYIVGGLPRSCDCFDLVGEETDPIRVCDLVHQHMHQEASRLICEERERHTLEIEQIERRGRELDLESARRSNDRSRERDVAVAEAEQLKAEAKGADYTRKRLLEENEALKAKVAELEAEVRSGLGGA